MLPRRLLIRNTTTTPVVWLGRRMIIALAKTPPLGTRLGGGRGGDSGVSGGRLGGAVGSRTRRRSPLRHRGLFPFSLLVRKTGTLTVAAAAFGAPRAAVFSLGVRCAGRLVPAENGPLNLRVAGSRARMLRRTVTRPTPGSSAGPRNNGLDRQTDSLHLLQKK